MNFISINVPNGIAKWSNYFQEYRYFSRGSSKLNFTTRPEEWNWVRRQLWLCLFSIWASSRTFDVVPIMIISVVIRGSVSLMCRSHSTYYHRSDHLNCQWRCFPHLPLRYVVALLLPILFHQYLEESVRCNFPSAPYHEINSDGKLSIWNPLNCKSIHPPLQTKTLRTEDAVET